MDVEDAELLQIYVYFWPLLYNEENIVIIIRECTSSILSLYLCIV